MVLKDGPTRNALKSRDGRGAGGTSGRDAGGGFAPLPKIDKPFGPRQPNRPRDARVLQGKLASLGYPSTSRPGYGENRSGVSIALDRNSGRRLRRTR